MSSARFEPHFGLTSDIAGDTAAILVQGNVANDAPDSGNPVKTGGVAVADCNGQTPAVAVGDRVNTAYDVNGRQIVLSIGNVANDAVDACNPVKTGGYAADEAPAIVSAVGDRVNSYYDRFGRQQTNFEKAIAGENTALHVLRTVKGKVPVEQESWLDVVIANVTGQVIKSSAGRLGRIQILNTGALGRFVILHDSTAFAVLGPIKWRGFVNAAVGLTPGVLDIGFEDADGIYFEIGISMVTSSTVDAIAGSVAVYGNALYV